MPPMKNNQPIFIICHARSGSTLLRYILDTHEQISCPPELHIGRLVDEIFNVVSVLTKNTKNSTDAAHIVNSHINNIMSNALIGKKNIWCDKSVSNVDHLTTLIKIFPEARFICLYRNCFDFIYSALEVSENGLKGFGFEDDLAQAANSTDALAAFWCKKTMQIMEFESKYSKQSLRLKQQDIVLHPLESAQKIFQFLKLPLPHDLIDNIFKQDHQSGAGDFKIYGKTRIELHSVGKGFNIPIGRIAADRLEQIASLHTQLEIGDVNENVNRNVPAHHKIGAGNIVLKSFAEQIIESIITDIKNSLNKKQYHSHNIPSLVLNIRDVDDSVFQLSFQKPYVKKLSGFKGITNLITINLYTLLSILDRRLDFVTSQLKGETLVEGDPEVLCIYMYLFN